MNKEELINQFNLRCLLFIVIGFIELFIGAFYNQLVLVLFGVVLLLSIFATIFVLNFCGKKNDN